jgi:hypothetical protein
MNACFEGLSSQNSCLIVTQKEGSNWVLTGAIMLHQASPRTKLTSKIYRKLTFGGVAGSGNLHLGRFLRTPARVARYFKLNDYPRSVFNLFEDFVTRSKKDL